jgi:hypothetical protein
MFNSKLQTDQIIKFFEIFKNMLSYNNGVDIDKKYNRMQHNNIVLKYIDKINNKPNTDLYTIELKKGQNFYIDKFVINYYEITILIYYLKHKNIHRRYKKFCDFIFQKSKNIENDKNNNVDYEILDFKPFSYYISDEYVNNAIDQLNKYEATLIEIINDILKFLNILQNNGIQNINLDYSNLDELY